MKVQTGIEYDDARVTLGLVSEFEERQACQEYGYRWADWCDMDTRERASVIAHRRVSLLISLHVHDATERAMKAERARAKSGGGGD